jgi:ABC-type transport system involved in multi-copper enzyme maturation permease subunit
MDIIYWGKYIVMVLTGILLILLSLPECLASLNLAFKPRDWLLSFVRYFGGLILIYSAYCIIIDAIIFRH